MVDLPNFCVAELYLNTWDGFKKLGNTAESSTYLEKAMEEYDLLPETIDGFHETTLQLCYALLEDQRYDEAVSLISKSIELVLDNYSAVELLAFALVKKNDKNKAIWVLKESAALMFQRGDEKNYLKLHALIKKLTGNNEM